MDEWQESSLRSDVGMTLIYQASTKYGSVPIWIRGRARMTRPVSSVFLDDEFKACIVCFV